MNQKGDKLHRVTVQNWSYSRCIPGNIIKLVVNLLYSTKGEYRGRRERRHWPRCVVSVSSEGSIQRKKTYYDVVDVHIEARITKTLPTIDIFLILLVHLYAGTAVKSSLIIVILWIYIVLSDENLYHVPFTKINLN